MKSKHICPACGGTTFFTVATVLQEWKVDACGEFDSVSTDCLETVCEPDDGNTWTCTECGNEGVLVDMTLSVTAMQLCANFMSRRINKHYNNNSLDVDSVFADTNVVFGEDIANAVLAVTILNNADDGRIDQRNVEWAKKVKLPYTFTRRDMISADLTCRGIHMGIANMLAEFARRREKQQTVEYGK